MVSDEVISEVAVLPEKKLYTHIILKLYNTFYNIINLRWCQSCAVPATYSND